MIKWLHKREITRCYSSPIIDLSCGLKTYHLREILPQSAIFDIFLGFSADGCFLVSYKSDFKHHILRFWLFPPASTQRCGMSLTLYAERKFIRSCYYPNLPSIPCVRFVQTLSSPKEFLLLACNDDGTGFVAAFGLIPDLDCSSCLEASSSRDSPTSRSTCSIHSRVLPLNLDLSHAQESSASVRSNVRDLNNPQFLSCDTQDIVPPCFRSRDGTCRSNNEGSCFASTGLPIGQIQVGVSANTGHLRIAWANPDAQVKVISCSFEKSINPDESSLCKLPKGMSTSLGHYPSSLVYKPPLLTHNYCSTCYSWPEEDQQCNKEHVSSFSVSSGQDSTKCIFSHDSLNILLVSDSLSWPDNHSNMHPDGAERICHQCSSNNFANGVQSKRRIFPDVWVPSLLSDRPCFLSCIQLTYLAMLQDIRASYLHWTLVSRNKNKMDNTSNLTNTAYTVYQNESSEEYASEWNINNSPLSSHASSDDDTEAMLSSPDSEDTSSSPEDLLVHRLSGQCHTSFDLTEWEEYIAPNVQTVTSDENSNCSLKNEKLSGRIIAHLEEVVFDIPVICVPDGKRCIYSNSSPVLVPFIPSEEPDLLLVYRMKPADISLCTSFDEASTECNTMDLLRIIDMNTGYSLPIPCKDQSPSNNNNDNNTNQTSFGTLTFPMLKKLTSQCPQNRKISSFQCKKRLLYELNNSSMAGRLESLKLLVDPQGDNDTPHQCVCSLDYSSFPIILLHSLPLKVQRLIANRLSRASLPQFVLTTHEGGQWSLVQLTISHAKPTTSSSSASSNEFQNNDSIQVDSSKAKPLKEVNNKEFESSPSPDWILSIHLNIDPYTTAYFSDSCVQFKLKAKDADKNCWYCPFCSAVYNISCSKSLPTGPCTSRTSIKHHVNSETCDLDRFQVYHCDNKETRFQKHDIPSKSVTLNSSSADSSERNWRRFCTKCNLGFKTPAQYQQHLKNVHRGRKFICQECNALFSTKGNLTKHFNQVHNQNAGLSCPICEKHLSNKFNLERHIRLVHTEKEIASSSSASKGKNTSVSDVPHSNTTESNEEYSSHQDDNTTVVSTANETNPRGYYLYLSDSECYQSVNTTAQSTNVNHSVTKPTIIQLNPENVDSQSVAFVADVSLTPCHPSNPEAQIGVGGKTWKRNISIVQSSKQTVSEDIDS
ncbi:unnamed protein product [Trichobilharzia szidati]|nr:unnamed protein product [Trichobilharzia szidati]